MTKKSSISPKIVVIGAGHIGQGITRLADKRGWPVVAAFNRAGDKIGKDLGQLAGLDAPSGVLVQDLETTDLNQLDADIAVVATTDRLSLNFPIYEKFLSAGINVLCNGAEAYNPNLADENLAAKIDTLAKQNGATFTGSGIWDVSRFWSGTIAAGASMEIEAIEHFSNTDLARHGEQYFGYAGVGLSQDEFEQQIVQQDTGVELYHFPSITLLEKLGYTVTNYTSVKEPIIEEEDFYCEAVDRTFPAGVALGTRVRVNVETVEGVTSTSLVDARPYKPGTIEEMSWNIVGSPGAEVKVIRRDSEIAAASTLFNRIPDVIAWEPGIVELFKHTPPRPAFSV